MTCATRRAFVFVQCKDPATAERHRLSALGLATLFCRWDILPAQISVDYPCSLDLEIADFRGESDLKLLRSLPGVERAEEFTPATAHLLDPLVVRREHISHPRPGHAA